MANIGILLFDGVEELDAVGPWEVFAAWTKFFPDDGYAVSCLSCDGKPVAAAKGMTLVPHHSVADAPAYDLFVHPGGQGTRPLMTDAAHLEWIRALRADVPLMTSVCTGSLVYAAAGVDDGDIVTSSGVSAGIDMALHLVRRLVSEDRAREVSRYIQYDPAPPV